MILAADLGSTNFKAALFTPDGRRVGEATVPLTYEIHTSERAELCPAVVVETFDNVLRGALESAAVSGKNVQRVALTSQAQTFCLCDKSGAPKGSFTSWSDQRAREEATYLQSVLGKSYHAKTGWPAPAAGQLAAQALWAKRHLETGLSSFRFVTLPSYLAMLLGAPFVIDRNLAAMTGLYNVPDGEWWSEALDAVGLSKTQVGTLVDTGQAVMAGNDVSPQLRCGIAPGEVVLVGNDHTAAAVGCGCSPHRAVLTIGTTGVFYRLPRASSVGPFSATGVWGPYPTGQYYELRFVSAACSALDWADQILFGRVDTPRFVAAAQEAGNPGELRFDPSRWGSATAWSGQGTAGQKARAVLEGIASALRGLAPAKIDAEQEIVVLGGGSRLDFWVQMLADMFQCPLIGTCRDGLTGAAMLAGCSTERMNQEPDKVFRPFADKDCV